MTAARRATARGGLWRDQPTQSPTRHAKVLGEAIDNESLRIDLQYRGCRHVVAQPVVDFVDDKVTTTLSYSLGQRRQFLQAVGKIQIAVGIIRRPLISSVGMPVAAGSRIVTQARKSEAILRHLLAHIPIGDIVAAPR